MPNDQQKRELFSIIGNLNATDAQIAQATTLLRDLDGIEYTQRLATRMVEEALTHLANVPASTRKDLLQQWAEYLIDRPL